MNESCPINEYQQIEALFQEAADLSREERRTFLEQHTPPGSEIRREVESLLANLDDESLPGIQLPAVTFDESGPEPERLGPYRLLRKLGRGGMGVVYLAEDTRLRRKVAIKVLTAFGARSRSLRTRLLREAEAASKLDHPAICRVYEVGEAEDLPYIAMQYIEGETLARRIAEERMARAKDRDPSTGLSDRQEIGAAVRLVETVARALHAAHEAGLVHRDVKPGNIMVTRSGDPILLDFGLARDVESATSTLTQTGQLMGTPAYMAPEQLRGVRDQIDRRTDVYALGVTLYEWLTHRRPFDAPTREQLYSKILTSEAPDPRRLNRSVAKDLKVVLDTALEKDPERRYDTAEAFAEDLRRVRELEPITARPVSTIGRVTRWARRRPARAALVAVLAIGIPLLTALGGYVVANQPAIKKQRQQEVEKRIERLLEDGFNELAHEASEKAITHFDTVLNERPNSLEAVSGKALALLEFNRAQACLDFLDRCGALLAREPFLQQLRFDALKKLGRETESPAVDFEPRTPLDHFLAGSRLMQKCELHYTDLDARRFQAAALQFENAVVHARIARPLYHFQLARAAHFVAAIASYSGRTDGAIDPEALCLMAANSLRELWPGSPDAWAWAGLALRSIRPEEALAACRQAIDIDPDHARAWQNFGESLQVRGEYDEALEAKLKFKDLVASDPDRAGVGFGVLGRYYFETKGRRDLPRATRFIQRAIELQPGNSRPLYGLASIYMAGENWEEAEGVLRRLIRAEPELGFPRSSLAYCLLMRGKAKEAVAEFEQALALWPDGLRLPAGYVNYGRALALSNRPIEAVAMIEKGLRQVERIRAETAFAKSIFPFGLAYITLGTLYLDFPESRDLEKAIEALEKARDLVPRRALVHSRLGRAHELHGDSKRAVIEFRKALAIEPENGAIWSQLGLLYGSHEQWKKSAKAFDRAFELDPSGFRYHHLHGNILRSAGRADDAIAAYRRAIQKNDSGYESHLRIGLIYRDRGDFERAVRHFEKAIELDDDRPGGYFHRGLLRMSRGECSDALADFLRAKDRGLNTPELICSIGLSHLHLGQLERALVHLREGHARGSPSESWSYPSGVWVKECERLQELRPKLDAVLRDEYRPESPEDQRYLAKIAFLDRRYGASAALYQDLFESERSLEEQRDVFLGATHRYAAACAGALAGVGQGVDARNFDESDRAAWRKQALEWLREDLESLEVQVDAAGERDSRSLARALRKWKVGPLTVLRQSEVLAGLPAGDRKAWAEFWAEIDQRIGETE